jgi:hypothetical protein
MIGPMINSLLWVIEAAILSIAAGLVSIWAVIHVLGPDAALPRAGRTTLNCPHCGGETLANRPLCRHCGQRLVG